MYFLRLFALSTLHRTKWALINYLSVQNLYIFTRLLYSKHVFAVSPILPALNLLNTRGGSNGGGGGGPNRDIPEIEDTDVEENITHLIILAKLALEKGDIDKAKVILSMGLKLADERKLTFGTPLIYDILIAIAINEGEIDKAESLLVTAIEKLVQDGSADDNNYIVDFKLRLARIYSNYKKDVTLADIGFKTCLDAQTRKILNGDVSLKTGLLYVNVLFWYGIHNIRNDRYREAKDMLNTAYDFSRKIKGLSPYQEMVILYTLADLNLELGELDTALSNMQTAVMLGKGISSSDLPRCYLKLARIYLQMDVLDQAEVTAKEARKLGDIFSKMDDVDEANLLLIEIEITKLNKINNN